MTEDTNMAGNKKPRRKKAPRKKTGREALEGLTPAQIKEALEGLSDEDKAQAAAYAATAEGGTPRADLDPTKPMWHLVPPSTMQDVVEILKELPYDKVHRVLPALMQAPLHQ